MDASRQVQNSKGDGDETVRMGMVECFFQRRPYWCISFPCDLLTMWCSLLNPVGLWLAEDTLHDSKAKFKKGYTVPQGPLWMFTLGTQSLCCEEAQKLHAEATFPPQYQRKSPTIANINCQSSLQMIPTTHLGVDDRWNREGLSPLSPAQTADLWAK